MRTNLIMAFLAICVLTGCTSQSGDLTPPDNPKMPGHNNPYHITIEEALQNLDDYFTTNNEGKTRSNGQVPKVKDVVAIHDSRGATRSSSASTNDTAALLYVANFDQQQGFAILSADKRISSLILAVTEGGNITDKSNLLVDQSDRILFNEFPLVGPGFFTDTIQGETETFINPNTIDFTNVEANDTLIGNLDVSAYTPLNSSINSRISLATQMEMMILDMALDYAHNSINHHDNTFEPIKPNPNHNNDPDAPGGPYISGKETDIVIVGPLLGKFKTWDQSPYLNIYFPKRFSFKKRKRVRVPTGCYPLALAKIMAYNQYPGMFSFNGHAFDWNVIRDDREGKYEETALFLKAIAECCSALYFGDGTFVFPLKAKQFMSSVGYRNVDNKNYSFDRVKQMIDANRPLAMCAYPAKGIFSSQAWNIDGYRTSKKADKNIKMVHCDFGWGGDYNGYYIDGIFDLDSSDNIYDGTHGDSKNNYKHYQHVMIYNMNQ